jgi:hypothetical protein
MSADNKPRSRPVKRPRASAARGSRVGPTCFSDTLERARHTARAKRAQRAFAISALDGPPPEVEREMAAALRVWQSLAAQGKELRFGTGHDGAVTVELTDSSGRALDTIGPAGLFRLLSQAR